jgi:hypothetical protein
MGCWPSLEYMEESVEDGTLTKVMAGTDDELRLRQGDFDTTTPYVWIHGAEDELWDTKRQKLVWKY